jgi:hypothetical protein
MKPVFTAENAEITEQNNHENSALSACSAVRFGYLPHSAGCLLEQVRIERFGDVLQGKNEPWATAR